MTDERWMAVMLHGTASLDAAHQLLYIALMDGMGWDGKTWTFPLFFSTSQWPESEISHRLNGQGR
jgi:hypothetical protein